MNTCLFLIWTISCVLAWSFISIFISGNNDYQYRSMLNKLRLIGLAISGVAVITTFVAMPFIIEVWEKLILFGYDNTFTAAVVVMVFCFIHVTGAVYNILRFPFLINYN